jgi:hypothetical protein
MFDQSFVDEYNRLSQLPPEELERLFPMQPLGGGDVSPLDAPTYGVKPPGSLPFDAGSMMPPPSAPMPPPMASPDAGPQMQAPPELLMQLSQARAQQDAMDSSEGGGGLLGGKPWGAMMMALGGGIAGGQGWGDGIGRGLQGAAAVRLKQDAINQDERLTRDRMSQAERLAKLRAQGEDQYFGTPTPFEKPDGSWGVGLPSKDGGFKELDIGAGNKYYPPTQQLDLGTKYQGVSKQGGVPVGAEVPIDNAGKAQDTSTGKAQGEAVESYKSMTSKLPGLQEVVTKLDTLAEQATSTEFGKARDYLAGQVGMSTEAGTARATYIATVNNQILPLLRDTFGAQFTAVEGESLKKTLGDPDLPVASKQAVLKAFIEQKVRDIEALERRGAGGAPADAPSGGASGGWTDMGGGVKYRAK